jgi:hypothetical protein
MDSAPCGGAAAEAQVVTLAPDLVCVAGGACDDAAPLLAACAPLLAGGGRVAVVRSVFFSDGALPPPLQRLLRPLGCNVVCVAASAVQSAVETRLVDEYLLRGRDGVPELAAQGVPLARYLTQRCAALALKSARALLLCPRKPLTRACPRAASVWRASGYQLRLAPVVAAAAPATSDAVQSTNSVLMVSPTAFESNAQAADDNAFMAAARDGGGAAAAPDVRAAVLEEYAGLHAALTRAGVRVRLFAHSAAHATPDACFPNNWFSLCSGTLTLYPMKCPNRAAERRPDIIAALRLERGATRELDLTAAEHAAPPAALEGTGSLVLDHLLRCAYVARSERSDAALAAHAATELRFSEVHAFDACDAAGRPICA